MSGRVSIQKPALPRQFQDLGLSATQHRPQLIAERCKMRREDDFHHKDTEVAEKRGKTDFSNGMRFNLEFAFSVTSMAR